LFGFGTWVAFGAGRVMVGFNSDNSLFNTAEETGGSADSIVVSHTHTVTDPGHNHTYTRYSALQVQSGSATQCWTGTSTQNTSTKTTGITIDTAGESGINANYQPYITVYMWKRTA
jgi:hypothetical protein